MVHTDIPEARWYVVESDDKRRARLNMIAHLLSTLDYHDVAQPTLKLPKRPRPRATSGRRGRAEVRARPRRDAAVLTTQAARDRLPLAQGAPAGGGPSASAAKNALTRAISSGGVSSPRGTTGAPKATST